MGDIEKDENGGLPVPPDVIIPEGEIRQDAKQGWNNLVETYADYDDVTPQLKIASLAQWILESGRGTSKLAKDHLNYGGIKYRDELKDFAVPVTYQASDGSDTYAKFEGDLGFIKGYWAFIGRSNYKGFEKYANDSLGYLAFIKSKGYAESPTYVEKVSKLFGEAEELLKRAGEVIALPPVPPTRDETPFNHEGHVYEEPKIEFVDIKSIIGHGKYSTKSGMADSLVQHFTAGWPAPGAERVISMLTSLGNREGRLGCFGMDDEGVIYVPKSLMWNQKGYHAGTSKFAGRSGWNSTAYGIEVCNPGKLVKVNEDYFYYFHVSDDKKKLLQGATAVDPKRVRIWTKDQPKATDQSGKQSKGAYMAFTEKQEKALLNFSLWRSKVDPDFSLDLVAGHDEISGSGKTDPGACLSMPMPEWRALLKRLAKK